MKLTPAQSLHGTSLPDHQRDLPNTGSAFFCYDKFECEYTLGKYNKLNLNAKNKYINKIILNERILKAHRQRF